MLLESVKSMPGEEIIREYSFPSAGCNFQSLSVRKKARGKKGTAEVCITNRRLICSYERHSLFRTAEKAFYQMNIKDIGDVCTAAARQSLLGPIALILLGILLFYPLIFLFLIPVAIIIAGIVWALVRSPLKVLDVRSKGGSGERGAGIMLYAKRRVVTGVGGFDQMSAEIGAIVSDIQSHGDDCLVFWKP